MKLMQPESILDAHGAILMSGWEELVREGRARKVPSSKMGSSTLSFERGKEGKPESLLLPFPPTPFGAHGGNFSRATITLVADNSNVLINAHRHASS